ncbi:MAG TPA: hypothetical protein VN761_11670, partial [Candidatus Polarisedimenticolia bacterium]|nr:hypothetical protein [Candidatus Polarisedimenticolia bacterium]
MLKSFTNPSNVRRPSGALRNHVSLLIMIFCAVSFRLSAESPDALADKLLSQMTQDEKIGQMVQADMLALKDKDDVRKYFLGSVLSGGSSDPAAGNSAKDWLDAVEEFKSEASQT